MRVAFLQLHQDGLVRARTMAGLLKIPKYAGVGLATELFGWALDMAPEHNGEIDLSGELDGDDPELMIAAGVGWEGDPGALFAAMIRVGFVQAAGEGPPRVRGLKLYADALPRTPAQRSAQASKAADARWAAERALREAVRPAPGAPAMLTDAPASQQQCGAMLIDAPDADADADADARRTTKEAATAPRPRPARKKPPDPRLAPLTAVLAADYENLRGQKYHHGGAKDAEALKRLLPLADDLEIRRRWVRAVEIGDAWPGCSTLAQLGAKWNDLAAPKGRQRHDPNDGIMTHRCDEPGCSQCDPAGYRTPRLEQSPEAA